MDVLSRAKIRDAEEAIDRVYLDDDITNEERREALEKFKRTIENYLKSL